MTDKALLTVREYAEQARVTERTIRRWITEGRLQALRQGKKYLIPREESAQAKLGTHARPSLTGAARPVGEGALRYLLFWIADAWVDNGAAQQAFFDEDQQGARNYFANLVNKLDQDAGKHVDSELALRLRFIARDLLNNLGETPEKAESPHPESQLAPTQQPSPATAPLGRPVAETLPLTGVK
jgi:excisionase family DNA binding protein